MAECKKGKEKEVVVTEKGKALSENKTDKETEKVVPEADELPKAIVRRLVKEKLSQISKKDGEISILRDALLAFSESGRIFIHYLSAIANDVCKDSKRQIINADDVFKALAEIEFSEFVDPLRASLEEFRNKKSGKRLGSKKVEGDNKKRKKGEAISEDVDNGKEDDNLSNDNGNDSPTDD